MTFGEVTGRRSDRELMELRARTLFTHDEAGRIVAVNETDGGPAPRFFLGWTGEGLVWRARRDLSAELVAHLGRLVDAAPATGDPEAPPACVDALRAALGEASAASVRDVGPAFCFQGLAARYPGVVLVTAEHAEVLRRWLPEWLPDAATRQPMFAALVDGDAVAVCACARRPGEASEAGVETHKAFRGRGLAAAVTAAWARALQRRGVLPLYSTSGSNLASQRVASKLGLRRFGASLSIA
jgi:hypothetical protein